MAVEKLGKGFFAAAHPLRLFRYPGHARRAGGRAPHGLALDPDNSTFFLGRETLVPSENPSLARWRVGLYMWLASNALSPGAVLPPAARADGGIGDADYDI